MTISAGTVKAPVALVCTWLTAIGVCIIFIHAENSVAQGAKAGSKSKSGYEYLEKSTRGMQDDDFANPGFFFVEAGEEAWNKIVGKTGKSCAVAMAARRKKCAASVRATRFGIGHSIKSSTWSSVSTGAERST